MSEFKKVTREYPAVSVHQRIDLQMLSDHGNKLVTNGVVFTPNSKEFNDQLQELIDLVCELKFLQGVENTRIAMEQDGLVTLGEKPVDTDENPS